MPHLSTCSCSRRKFLKGSGLLLGGFGIASLFPSPLIRHALASAATNDQKMIFIFMRGGNDGLNTVIPHGDADYNATTNRPTLYISPTESIPLNGFASLHPSLQDLMPAFDADELAVIHRVGYTDSSRSHFDGQRIWENGDPTRTDLFEGWLYRYVRDNIAAGAELPVLTAQDDSPLLLRGEERFVNVANPDEFDYPITDPLLTKFSQKLRARYANLVGLEPFQPVLSQTGVKLVDTLDIYRSWDQANWNPLDPDTMDSLFPVSDATNPDDPAGPNGKRFHPDSYEFFRSLKLCALSLLESAAGGPNATRVAGTQIGGWDSHDNQGSLNGVHATLLSWLAYGMRSLRIALSGTAIDPRGYPGIWNKTVVATMSEFGRTSKENGSLGTDHAAASCLFLQGGCVKGGVYNCDAGTWPVGSMFDINGRYLSHRTDYRSVFWEILRDHMGAPASGVEATFPGYGLAGLAGQELGLFNACPTEMPIDL